LKNFSTTQYVLPKMATLKGRKIFSQSFSQKEKGVDCHEFKNGIT